MKELTETKHYDIWYDILTSLCQASTLDAKQHTVYLDIYTFLLKSPLFNTQSNGRNRSWKEKYALFVSWKK